MHGSRARQITAEYGQGSFQEEEIIILQIEVN
jgi:hypothetical protein